MADENPTVEAPEQPQEQPKEEWTPEKIEGIISELEAANVSTPQDLVGKLEASRQAGQTANLLGEARNEIRALREEVAKAATTKPEPQYDEFEQPSQAVDLESAIAKAIRKERDLERKQTAEQQAAVNAKWNSIVTNRHYPHVKEVWDEKLKDPNFVYQINMNLVDPVQAYNDTVIEFYQGLSQKAAVAMKNMQGNKVSVSPPNMESNQTPSGPEIDVTEEFQKIKKLQEKALKGDNLTEQERLDALDALIPPGFLDG